MLTGFTRRKSYWRSFLTLVACGAVVSCGGGGNGSSPASVKAAQLALNASSINFGNVAVGGKKSSAITLSNPSPTGGPDVVITQAIASGSGFAVKTPVMPLTLAAGQSTPLTVTFAPLLAGSNNGRLSIGVQGESQPALVGLSGVGLAGGQVAVNPTAINFGSVTVGRSQTQNGSLSAGGADINISSASCDGPGYTLSGVSFPALIPAGTSISFKVTFAPESSGSASGQVSFSSDGSNSPTVVSLTGTGLESAQHTVSLSWTGSTSQVAGYNIYRRTQSNGSFVRLNTSLITALDFSDDTVQSGATYYYAATSVDPNDLESPYSNIATAVIP